MKKYVSDYANFIFNILIKRSIFTANSIIFTEGYGIAEDFEVTLKLLYYTNSYYHCDKALYHYNFINNQSICHQLLYDNNDKSEKLKKDWILMTVRAYDFFKETDYINELNEIFCWRILWVKWNWIFDKNHRKEYRLICPESNKHIDSNPNFGKIEKLCQKIIMIPSLSFLLPILHYINKKYLAFISKIK